MEFLNTIFENAVSNKTKDLKIHIVYAGLTYSVGPATEISNFIFGFIVYALQTYELKSVLITMLTMERVNLVTKEAMKEFYKGNRIENKQSGDEMFKMYGISMNDDFEEVFEKINRANYLEDEVPDGEFIGNGTFFLPKITEEEHRFVLKMI